MSVNLYEKSRIKNRADERDHIQKCLFTNWINAQLDGVFSSEFLTYLSYPNDLHNSWAYHNSSMNRLTHSPSWETSSSTHRSYAIGHTYLVKELYNDLRDGRILLRLLELLSGKQFNRFKLIKLALLKLWFKCTKSFCGFIQSFQSVRRKSIYSRSHIFENTSC
ncbi:unnamed protein product [Schistosoma intercalatum]|nr:unnamed protein product [Schistosoma intercalatum]